MRFKKLFRSYKNNPFILALSLMLGMLLAVGGSVFATTIGTNVSTSNLTVTGNAGIGTTTAGTLLSVQGVGNFANAATSTLYTDFRLRSLSATSTLYLADGTALVPSLSFTDDTDTGLFRVSGNILGFTTGGSERAQFSNSGSLGVGTTTPGGFLGLTTGTSSPGFLLSYTGTGPALYIEDAANDTSPFVIDSAGNVGIGTTTPGTVFAVQDVANFATDSSTVYRDLTVPQIRATSTVATSTFSNGLNVATSAGSLGVGTTTPIKTISVSGDALLGSGANGTSTLTVNASGTGVGSCIELRAASSSDIYRIYVSNYQSSSTPLMVERGSCR